MISSELARKRCVPCEGGVPRLDPPAVAELIRSTPSWQVTPDGLRIRREWTAKDFRTAMGFFNKVAAIAEDEGHHPDLHLTEYRHVAVEVWTHAAGGLTENDFILAAKIDLIPFDAKSPRG